MTNSELKSTYVRPASRTGAAYLFMRSIVFAVILAAAFGCAGSRGAKAPDYDEEFERWTKSVKIYDGIETVAIINATYKSPAFVEAYVEKYARSIKADEDYKKVILSGQLADTEKFNEIFMTLYTPDDKWNDLVRFDASIWRLYLEDGSGARLTPVSIRRIDKDDVILRQFFPYYDEWNTAYVIQFPKYAVTSVEPVPFRDAQFLRFTMTGILGEGRIEWGLK